MSVKGSSAQPIKRLVDGHGPLLDRLLRVPEMITGVALPLSSNEPPLKELFGAIKQRRDAFVHCEPGEHESRPGFVKQERFHDVNPDAVDAAVSLTVEVVQKLWRHVHGADAGPAWLKTLGNRSAFKRSLILSPSPHNDE
jgi:hypothetical protein